MKNRKMLQQHNCVLVDGIAGTSRYMYTRHDKAHTGNHHTKCRTGSVLTRSALLHFLRRNVMRRRPSVRCARADARSASLGSGHDAEKERSVTLALKRLSRPFATQAKHCQVSE